VLAAVLLLAVAAVLVACWHWRYEFHRRIEAIRAAGFPVTLKELDAWYPWPETGQNAAQWVLGANDGCIKLDPEDEQGLRRLIRFAGDRVAPTEPVPDELMTLLERHIRNNSQALEMLHRVTIRAEGRYPVDLSQTPTRLDHLESVRDHCLLLSLEAVWHAQRGDPNAMIAAVEAVLGIAGSLDAEPMIGSRMAKTWALVWAAGALERALCQAEFTAPQLERLRSAFLTMYESDSLARALMGHRCVLLPVFEAPAALDERFWGRLPPRALLEAYGTLGLAAREGSVFLDYMAQCIRIAGLPVWQRLPAIRAAENRYLPPRKKTLLLAKTGLMSRHVLLDTQAMTWLALTTTALMVESGRIVEGRLPETLGRFTLRDPFDGEPLRYRRTDRGFLVYSVGEDGRDQGGEEAVPGPTERTGAMLDMVFRVERPVAPQENAGRP
jgi:hypothetical protein